MQDKIFKSPMKLPFFTSFLAFGVTKLSSSLSNNKNIVKLEDVTPKRQTKRKILPLT